MKGVPRSTGRLVAEFFLIVLGVLVALAADTAFENRRDNDLRDKYLSRIASDLLIDSTAIENRIEFFTDVQRFSADVIAWLETDAPADKELLLASFYAAEIWPFVSHKGNFEDLYSTGNIRLLKDIDLRTSLSLYYNRTDESREGWWPSRDYRRVIRGIIPIDVQDKIRRNCPTTDAMDLEPTGFPPCELPGIDYEKLTRRFARLKTDESFHETLTYRHSEVGVLIYLLSQQQKLGANALARVEAQ
jgi:hypothetical protein